jgi:hypothetical protein
METDVKVVGQAGGHKGIVVLVSKRSYRTVDVPTWPRLADRPDQESQREKRMEELKNGGLVVVTRLQPPVDRPSSPRKRLSLPRRESICHSLIRNRG